MVPGVSVWRFSSGAAPWPPAPLHEVKGLSCHRPLVGPGGNGASDLCTRLTSDLSPDVGGPADPIAPTVIIPPKNTSVVAGTSEVTMECVANARPLIKLHIVWKKDGVPLSGGISDYNRRLTIPNPTGGDAGYYECEAVLRSSSVPAVVRGAYLSVLEPPQFVKEPERHITAEMEKLVDIPCRAKGVPPPSITWYKDAAVVEVEKLARFRQRGDGSLQISGLAPDDTGMFQCFARNAAGEVQTSTYLAVTSESGLPCPATPPVPLARDAAVLQAGGPSENSTLRHAQTGARRRPLARWCPLLLQPESRAAGDSPAPGSSPQCPGARDGSRAL
nr:protein sidekick-2-like [Microcebus murinus]